MPTLSLYLDHMRGAAKTCDFVSVGVLETLGRLVEAGIAQSARELISAGMPASLIEAIICSGGGSA